MNTDNPLCNLSLLAARLTLGSSIAAHGSQKMFGAFDGPGIEGASQMMESLGFKPGEKYARALATTELTSGTLIALGALGPVGPAMLLSVMFSAVQLVHKPKGYFNDKGGYELNTMYVTIALLLATQGYGSISVDALLGIHEKTGATLGWLALGAGVAAAMMMLGQRNVSRPTQRQTPASTRETEDIETPATVS
jgi:putative oxidoreductase